MNVFTTRVDTNIMVISKILNFEVYFKIYDKYSLNKISLRCRLLMIIIFKYNN